MTIQICIKQYLKIKSGFEAIKEERLVIMGFKVKNPCNLYKIQGLFGMCVAEVHGNRTHPGRF